MLLESLFNGSCWGAAGKEYITWLYNTVLRLINSLDTVHTFVMLIYILSISCAKTQRTYMIVTVLQVTGSCSEMCGAELPLVSIAHIASHRHIFTHTKWMWRELLCTCTLPPPPPPHTHKHTQTHTQCQPAFLDWRVLSGNHMSVEVLKEHEARWWTTRWWDPQRWPGPSRRSWTREPGCLIGCKAVMDWVHWVYLLHGKWETLSPVLWPKGGGGHL